MYSTFGVTRYLDLLKKQLCEFTSDLKIRKYEYPSFLFLVEFVERKRSCRYFAAGCVLSQNKILFEALDGVHAA